MGRKIRVWRDLPDELRIPFDGVWRHLNEALKVVTDQMRSPYPFTEEDCELLRHSVNQVRSQIEEFEAHI